MSQSSTRPSESQVYSNFPPYQTSETVKNKARFISVTEEPLDKFQELDLKVGSLLLKNKKEIKPRIVKKLTKTEIESLKGLLTKYDKDNLE